MPPPAARAASRARSTAADERAPAQPQLRCSRGSDQPQSTVKVASLHRRGGVTFTRLALGAAGEANMRSALQPSCEGVERPLER